MNSFLKMGPLFISIISSIGSLFYFILKKDYKKEKQYYENVVLPYISRYVDNEKINAIIFLKSKINRTHTFIPFYIFYLCDKGREDELSKVLIYDYLSLSDNQTNKISRWLSNFSNLVYYFSVIFYFVFLLLIIIVISSTLMSLVLYFFTIKEFNCNIFFSKDLLELMWDLGYGVCIFIAVCVLIKFSMLYFKMKDRYTLYKQYIEKSIEKKVKSYPKIIEKYYFFEKK